MNIDDQKLLAFLEPQIRDFGGNVEIDQGLWTLFAVAAADQEANAIARSLLAGAKFAHHSGESEDDKWVLYYVDTANRPEAVHWLDDLYSVVMGEIRPATVAQRALIKDLAESSTPHRIAQQLVAMHARGELSAGALHEPAIVRTLLDRLHLQEPLVFAAFQSLLADHLIDLIVLLQQVIPEDVQLVNENMQGSLSRDPFMQSRQNAAADIRNLMIRFQVINPMDQQRNTAITNPYAALMDVFRTGEEITAPIDGNPIKVPRRNFTNAIRAIRRNLYRGEQFGSFNTQVPWMNEEIAYSFRFIKQRLGVRRDLPAMDGLFMLERAVERRGSRLD
jgi:hypothetical protein